ncbi:MAG: adenylosuccinate lyase [Acidimicrobiia bacterium]|nr:adenylosuccinate lyase [Acidimicrobiia bacterium]
MDKGMDLSNQAIRYAKALAVSPIDGRYGGQLDVVSGFFSEFALVRERARIEVEWVAFLLESRIFKHVRPQEDLLNTLRRVGSDLTLSDFERVKDLERETDHDIQAIERFLREKLTSSGLERVGHLLHLGLTSEDVSSVAYGVLLRRFSNEVWLPLVDSLLDAVVAHQTEHRDSPMLARTHGQPAIPTTFGREMQVFHNRLRRARKGVAEAASRLTAKFGGAVGSLASLAVVRPDVDWITRADQFVSERGLRRTQVTTQIDDFASYELLFHCVSHANSVVQALCEDMSGYGLLEYVTFSKSPEAVGSSAMPHKSNPIRFENAEANAELSSEQLVAISRLLRRSRFQRDLRSSTVQRNIGTALAHSLLALDGTKAGLDQIQVQHQKMLRDVEESWGLLAEAIHTVARTCGHPEVFDDLRRQPLSTWTRSDYESFVDSLPIAVAEAERLRRLTPRLYAVGAFGSTSDGTP